MTGETPSDVTPQRSPSASPRIGRWALALLLVGGVGVWRLTRLEQPSVRERLTHARAALRAGQLEQSEQAVRAVLKIAPEDSAAWLLLATISERQQQFDTAIEAYEHVTEAKSLASARLAAGRLCLRTPGRLAQAERHFETVYQLDPANMEACEGLAQVLAVSGRSREVVPLLIAMIQGRAFSNFHLYLLSCGGESTVDPQLIGDATDARSRVARGNLLLKRGDPITACTELRQARAAEPDWDWAQLMLGRALLEAEVSPAEIVEWHRSLSSTIEDHPDYWQLAAQWSRRRGDLAAAARCDGETVRRDPNCHAACFQLGRWLRESGDTARSDSFLNRADDLQRYKTIVETARNGDDLDALRQTVELAEKLGLIWEAYGWSDMAVRLADASVRWPRELRERFAARLKELPAERTTSDQNPAIKLDLSHLPLPQFNAAATEDHTASVVTAEGRSPIGFRDDAAAVGLTFQYVNGGDPIGSGLQRMFEFTGGGVAVIDYDRDEWPDAYFVQGSRRDNRDTKSSDLDRLFRNTGDGQFVDVTPQVGIEESQFGQGVAVGDVDQDGFSDLVVTNLNENRLYRNQGDGTFVEDLPFSKLAGSAWSTSAVVADLNSDGIPDIYVVNYLGGEDVFDRVCENQRRDRKQTCRPTAFPAADDQLLLGQGDGQFIDVTSTAGILQPDGRGLGVVAAVFDEHSRLGLFVANDGTANFHFAPVESGSPAAAPNSGPLFEDQARLVGTAFDDQGRAQACMGVATGDINGDGRLDLFVTNFEDETNTLYVQQSGGLFQDRTREYGLAAPSLKRLGFGTQLLDANLDGWLDLLVANGHVNNTGDAGSAYRMPPQLFENMTGRRFVERTSSQLGPYFAGEYLGRAVAVWDWNRDGLTDAVITHLDVPASLLTNTTPTAGRWLSVRLVGTASERDAIGTRIEIAHAGRVLHRQLTAGDGYLASNERRVTFGLGETKLDTVTLKVTWPSGGVATVTGVPLDRHVVLIEGTARAVTLNVPAALSKVGDR